MVRVALVSATFKILYTGTMSIIMLKKGKQFWYTQILDEK